MAAWFGFFIRGLILAGEFLSWRKKRRDQEVAQAVADSPKTADEVIEALEKGNV